MWLGYKYKFKLNMYCIHISWVVWDDLQVVPSELLAYTSFPPTISDGRTCSSDNGKIAKNTTEPQEMSRNVLKI